MSCLTHGLMVYIPIVESAWNFIVGLGGLVGLGKRLAGERAKANRSRCGLEKPLSDRKRTR